MAALRHALASGARLLLPSGGKFSPQTFWQEARKHGMTQATVVPTMLTILLANADKSYLKSDPPPLKFFRSAGAQLPASVEKGVQDKFGVQVYEVQCFPSVPSSLQMQKWARICQTGAPNAHARSTLFLVCEQGR